MSDEAGERLETIVTTVVGRLAPHPVPVADPDQLLVDDLGYHSLALVELAFLLEEMFSLEQIKTEEAADIKSVSDVVTYVSGAIDPTRALPDDATIEGMLDDFVAPED